jgi:hypothetical protein
MALCSNIEAARLFYLEHHWPQDSTESEPDLKDFIRIFFSVGINFIKKKYLLKSQFPTSGDTKLEALSRGT